MKPKKILFASIFLSSLLVVAKLLVGIFSHSIALIAEAIHAIVDVVSALVTLIGIRVSEKPADAEHPYGHERSESIAGFIVMLILLLSGVWVLYEAIPDIINQESNAKFTMFGIYVMLASLVINFELSRQKFISGKKYNSVGLIADAKSARADVISTVAVLITLLIVRFYPLADSIIACLVALYIFYESYHLARETINLLLDTANPKLEVKVKRYLNGRGIQYSELKTRRAGSSNIAEVTLHFPPELIASSVTDKIEEIEKNLVDQIDELKEVTIGIKPIEFKEELIRPKFGKRYRYRKVYKV